MRHFSERVPGKNYRSFNGKPLYHHIINTLSKVTQIDKIIIDTDSPFILEDAKKYFPKVILLERPEHLRDGEIPMNEVLLNTIKQVKADFYLQTHSTNPILSASTIEKSIIAFLDVFPSFDSLFGVTKLHTRLWNDQTQPINHNPNVLLRTQDLPPVFEENSCIYIFTQEILEKKGNRIGYKPMKFEIPKKESWDIDDEDDYLISEYLFKLTNK